MPYYNLPTNIVYTVDDVIRLSQAIQQVKRNIKRYEMFGPGMDWEKAKRNREYVKKLTIELAAAVLAIMT